jgi:solute carrier family 45, member 1/2/4
MGFESEAGQPDRRKGSCSLETDAISQGKPQDPAGLWQVFAPCIAFAGVQASWAIQIGHSSAELRRLGVTDENIGLVWLAGPISGVIVQPIVGVLSDRCTSGFGRRRP